MAIRASNQRWRAITTIAIGLAAVVVLTIVSRNPEGPLHHLELNALDLMVYAHAPPPPTGMVVIAGIDDKSIAEFGRWPWARSVHACLVAALKSYGVAFIGSDDLLSERDPADLQRAVIAAQIRQEGVKDPAVFAKLGESNDEIFARALKEQGETYLGD